MTKPTKPWRCQRCTILDITIPRDTPRSRLCRWCARELRERGLLWCSTGRHAQPPSAFTVTGRRHYTCQACQAEKNRAWRAEHHEEALAYNVAYHAARRSEHIVRDRAYYREHREVLLQQKREYYRERAEAIKARVRAYRPKRPLSSIEKERQRHQEKRAEYAANERLARARRLLSLLRGGRKP